MMESREVAALRALQHPNIIRLLEVIREGTTLYLVYEKCDLTLLDALRHPMPQPVSNCFLKQPEACP